MELLGFWVGLLEAEGGKPIEIRWSPTNSTHFVRISGRLPQNRLSGSDSWEFRSDLTGIGWSPANSTHSVGISGGSPQTKWGCWGFWVGLLAGSGRRETN